MVIVKTPLRMSFFGGGTDHPSWFRENGGAVLSTSIDKYIYLQMRRIYQIFDFSYRILWSKVERVNTPAEIEHPVVRAVLQQYWHEKRGLEIVYNADLPARSGLGSSSAFTVSLLQGLWAEMGKIISKRELAELAIMVERDLLKEPVGCQDQIAVAYGGCNRIDFLPSGDFHVTPVPLGYARRDELERNMMMFFTGFTRDAGNVEKEKMSGLVGSKEKTLRRMHEMVPVAERLLLNVSEPLSSFGELMNETWQLKRSLAGSVSNSKIDDIYDAAMAAGADGGKLLGAGGGGFFVFMVEPEHRKAVRRALSGLVEVPIRMDMDGSRIAMYEPSVEPEALDGFEVAEAKAAVA